MRDLCPLGIKINSDTDLSCNACTVPPQQAASSSSTSTPKPPAVSDNVVDVTEEEAKKSDHFFYGNAPVLEYRPNDGTSGRKTPR